MPAPKQSAKTVSKTASVNLTHVAHKIAGEVARGSKTTTLRHLLKRCGYERRTAQTLRRIEAALDAAGVQCLPPPAGVKDFDGTLQLQATTFDDSQAKTAACRKPAGHSTKKNVKALPRFKSLEAMLAYARLATVLVKLSDGHGSGFVVDPSGLVLTARHVIETSEAVCLRFENGEEVTARVIFSDPALDYAFVQGPPRKEFLPLNRCVKLAIGQTIYAIGTPFQTDLSGSVSRGIISGLDRIVGGVNYIQTDATIHSGHSGGPLLTQSGEVAGINLWGRPEEGIRFALPVCYLAEALNFVQSQIAELNTRLYCTSCGFLNGPDSWMVCSSWLCCGHCGMVLGDFKASASEPQSDCETDELEDVKADREQMFGREESTCEAMV